MSDQAKNFAVIYLIDISEVPDFNTMYELYDPCTIMFFFRNKVGRCPSPACWAGPRAAASCSSRRFLASWPLS